MPFQGGSTVPKIKKDHFAERLNAALNTKIGQTGDFENLSKGWDNPLRWFQYLRDNYAGDRAAVQQALQAYVKNDGYDLARINGYIGQLTNDHCTIRYGGGQKDWPGHELGELDGRSWGVQLEIINWLRDPMPQLITELLLPYTSMVVGRLISDNPDTEPWNQYRNPDKAPITYTADDSCWLWRADDREPEDIFGSGFYPKTLSKRDASDAVWKAIVKVMKDHYASADTAPIRYRYTQKDLCTETAIALATHWKSAAVFPFIYEDHEQEAPERRIVNAGIFRKGKITWIRGGSNGVMTYVYLLRVAKNRISDTAFFQHTLGEQPWPEVATNYVEPGWVLGAIALQKFPKDRHTGYCVPLGWKINENGPGKDSVPESIIQQLRGHFTNTVYEWQWSVRDGTLTAHR
jgi:hypothetical protein